MKAKEKPFGIKHKVREERKREQRIGMAVMVAILIAVILVSGFIVNSLLNQPSTSQTVSLFSLPRAAIVDLLSLSYPNQTFIGTTTNILKQANYSVDYYPGEKVTVELYRSLPTSGYSLIILRVHSTSHTFSGEKPIIVPTVLFTSELYSTEKYLDEQLADQVFRVAYDTGSDRYFAIGPSFILDGTHGDFKNTTIIMMGCEGIINTEMARAFVSKGARAYIGWNGGVSASHTDQATTQLLQHLVTEDQTIKQAVENTIKEVGPDPACNNTLEYYPPESGNHAIQN
jgi:hypothetical protein